MISQTAATDVGGSPSTWSCTGRVGTSCRCVSNFYLLLCLISACSSTLVNLLDGCALFCTVENAE
jgi:hypothetical protein